MSWRLTQAVLDSALPAWLKPYAIALGNSAHDDGRDCFPSVRRLARETGRVERQVRYALKELRRLGVLELVRPSTRTRPNEYRFIRECLPQRGDGFQIPLVFRQKPRFSQDKPKKQTRSA